MRPSFGQRSAEEPLRLGLLRYGREGIHTPPRRARRRGGSRRGRRCAPGSAAPARDSRRPRAHGSRLPRARACRGCRRSRGGDLARVDQEQEVRSAEPADRLKVEVEHAVEPEAAPDALVRDRGVHDSGHRSPRLRVRARDGSPRRRAAPERRVEERLRPRTRRATWRTSYRRLRRARCIPAPGWRRRPLPRSRGARRSSAWVDFPEPSRPSA